MGRTVLAVDIGGSKLAVGLVDQSGSILKSERRLWQGMNADAVVRTVIECCSRLLSEINPVGVMAESIGVNIPGLADSVNGMWVEACFSGIRDLPLCKLLYDAFRIPAYLDNDVNNCALGEKLFGACKDCTDFLWVTVSNGCGGALYLDDKQYFGIRNTAGEIGHSTVEENNGHLCGCGNTGCLEAEAAGPGIVKRFLEAGGEESIEGKLATAELIAMLARNGNDIARNTYQQEGYYLGKAISAAINLLAPQKVIIGGGVSGTFDLFYPTLIKTVEHMTYRKATDHVIIERTALGNEAALIGAAALALSRHRPV